MGLCQGKGHPRSPSELIQKPLFSIPVIFVGTAHGAVDVSCVKAQLQKGKHGAEAFQVFVKCLIRSIDHSTIQQKRYEGVSRPFAIEMTGSRDNGEQPGSRWVLLLEGRLGIDLMGEAFDGISIPVLIRDLFKTLPCPPPYPFPDRPRPSDNRPHP